MSVIKKAVTAVGIALFLVGIASAESQNILIPVGLMAAGLVIAFLGYESEEES